MKMTLNKLNLYLGCIILLLLPLAAIEAYFLLQMRQENKSLQQAVQLLENGFNEERQSLQLQFREMQVKIDQQEQLQQTFHRKLSVLGKERLQLNTTKNEEKNAIARLRDVDSLRNALTGHYRP